MRNFSLGVDRRNVLLFTVVIVLAFVLTVVWSLFLVDPIGGFWVGEEQRINKYILTIVLYGLAFVTAIVSLGAGVRGASRSALLPGFLVRFGMALELIGIAIIPIALYFAADPTRSVPLGFAAFSLVMIGLIIAGVGGNMLVPRRA